jgi:DNA replication protein DnaC
MTDRYQELAVMLRSLNLTRMATTFAEVAMQAARESYTHEAFLYELVRQEVEYRTQRRVERRLRESGLPREKTFGTLQVERFGREVAQQIGQLRHGTFVREAMNVVAVGKPGVGKSHLAAALGHELITQGHTVYWSSTATLVQRLLAAKRDLSLPRELTRLDRYSCLILDDIGYVQHDRDEMEILFTLLAERYERRSVVITTNLVFSEWNRIFKDPMTTMAAIDRVVHHAVILDLMGLDSFRAREAMEQQTKRRNGATQSPAPSRTPPAAATTDSPN